VTSLVLSCEIWGLHGGQGMCSGLRHRLDRRTQTAQNPDHHHRRRRQVMFCYRPINVHNSAACSSLLTCAVRTFSLLWSLGMHGLNVWAHTDSAFACPFCKCPGIVRCVVEFAVDRITRVRFPASADVSCYTACGTPGLTVALFHLRISWALPLRAVIAFYSENHTKSINTLRGQNSWLLNVKADGTYSCHRALKG
jgi:hypothetical protein